MDTKFLCFVFFFKLRKKFRVVKLPLEALISSQCVVWKTCNIDCKFTGLKLKLLN